MLRLFVFIDKLQEEDMAPIAFIIGTVWPEPRSSAAGQHLLSLLSELKQLGYIIHFASTAQRSENSEGLDELGCVVHEIVLNDSSFDQLIAQLQPEIAVFDRFMVEEQFSWRIKKVAPNTCLILDTEDFHSLRYLRHQIIKKHPEQAVDIPSLLEINAEPGPFQGCLNSDFAVREIASMWRCDINLIISQAEVALLHTYYGLPKNILHYCPFLMANDRDALGTPRAIDNRKDFVFIGNYRRAPNWDAVQILAKHLWPIIRKELPQAKCRIYGAYTPEKAQQFHNPKQGLLISGWAKDAQATIQEARVHLAPLRFGAGLKGKIFDSLRVGTPCVGSDMAWEGISTDVTAHSLQTLNDYEDFAAQAIVLYEDEDKWLTEQVKGQQILENEFVYTTHSSALKNKIQTVTQDLNTHRAPLFMQKMLEQTQYRATRFMSQWIEAKQIIEQLRDAGLPPETD